MLFSETLRQINKYKKIGGSRILPKLIKKRDKLYKEIGEKEGLNNCIKKYNEEEDATDLRAIEWGFKEEIEVMRKRSKSFDFYFRFARD